MQRLRVDELAKVMHFLGGVFFDYELPRERQYLFFYFRTNIEKAFLYYYYCFGDIEYFTDRTGWFCQKRWLRLLKRRHDKLVFIHNHTKSNMDFTKLARIERGKEKKIGF